MSDWFFDPLKRNAYDLIVCDAPWPFALRSEKGNAKSASAQYSTMTMEDIHKLPVRDLAAKDCLLLHWVVAPRLDECIDVMKSWGFKYVSFMHWRKVSQYGMPMMGTGFRVRTMGELCLVGTIGNPKHKPFNSDFAGIRRAHSQKPESFYHMIDRCCPDLLRRADLFGRQTRSGWDVFGDEANKFDREAS